MLNKLLRLNISTYIKQLLSYEEYAFSLDELLSYSNKTEVSLRRELSRLVTKKEIINLRKGFYLIIPPRYSKQFRLPIQLYINKLFQHLKKPYYLGFYTAAKFHGAGHQKIHKDYVMTNRPSIALIHKNSINIKFFTTKNWSTKNIIHKRSDAGVFKISSPALTAVDLIHHQSKLGGLNRMLANLEELFEEITKSDLIELLKWYPYKSTLQRLGFLLEEIKEETHCEIVYNHLNKTKYFPILLSPQSNQKPGSVYNKWKVDVNVKLESDL